MMRKKYQEHLKQLKLTDESKAQLIQNLKNTVHGEQRSVGNCWRRIATAAAVAACLCVTVFAAYSVYPVLKDYYQNSPGYQQSTVTLGDSITKHGWTLTVTDAVMDNYNVQIGICMEAPEGTVLDNPDGYQLENWKISVPEYEGGSSGGYDQVVDQYPDDNAIQFILTSEYSMDQNVTLQGKTMNLTLGGLHHREISDCEEIWNFKIKLDLPDNRIVLEPNIMIHTLDVDVNLSRVEVTPFGVYAYIEGDALKGHHDWTPKNAPDGWYGCVEYQEVVLNLTDGTSLPLTDGISGSGCSGGSDLSEPGWLHIARRAEELIDLEQVTSITICGENIPIK